MTEKKYLKVNKINSTILFGLLGAILLFSVLLIFIHLMLSGYEYSNQQNFIGHGENIGVSGLGGFKHISLAQANDLKIYIKLAQITFILMLISFISIFSMTIYKAVVDTKGAQEIANGKSWTASFRYKLVTSLLLIPFIFIILILAYLILQITWVGGPANIYDEMWSNNLNDINNDIWGARPDIGINTDETFLSLWGVSERVQDMLEELTGQVFSTGDISNFIEAYVYNGIENGNEQLANFVWVEMIWDFNGPLFLNAIALVFGGAIILISTKSTRAIKEAANEQVEKDNNYNSYGSSNSISREEESTLSTKGMALVTSLLVTSMSAIALLIWRLTTAGEFIIMDNGSLFPDEKIFFNPLTTILIFATIAVAIVNAIFSFKSLKTASGTKTTSIVGLAYGSLLTVLAVLGIIMTPVGLTMIFVILLPGIIAITSSALLLKSDEDSDGDTDVIYISGIITAAIISLGMKFSFLLMLATFGLGIAVIVIGSLSFKKDNLIKVLFILAIVLGSLLAIESLLGAMSYNKMTNLITYIPLVSTDNYFIMYLLINLPAAGTLITLGALGLKNY